MARRKSLRSQLYRAARDLGNVRQPKGTDAIRQAGRAPEGLPDNQWDQSASAEEDSAVDSVCDESYQHEVVEKWGLALGRTNAKESGTA
jgi:hypothetical protein